MPKSPIRILQLIDSLDAGGAERMAVNFANEWCALGEKSYIFVTNKDGVLSQFIDKSVLKCVLNRKQITILGVVLMLLYFLKKHKISHIQAHTSSNKWVNIIKYFYPSIQFYWHDHNGNRANWDIRENNQIILRSQLFDGVFCCSTALKEWSTRNLKCQNIIEVSNFSHPAILEKSTYLKGTAGKRIVCVANLRAPKNHHYLVDQFRKSKINQEGWTLHLIGGDYQNTYSDELKNIITEYHLEGSVFLYGAVTDINFILSQSEVGILVSTYEGFPVSLIEYGMFKLCPIVSNVGNMHTVVEHLENGYVVDLSVEDDLKNVLKELATTQKYTLYGQQFFLKINTLYSGAVVVKKLLQFLK